MTKVNQLDFTGTTIFCGIDVHKLSLRVNPPHWRKVLSSKPNNI